MNELETFATMLSGEHAPERLKKILGHIDEHLKKMNKLREIALTRIKEAEGT